MPPRRPPRALARVLPQRPSVIGRPPLPAESAEALVRRVVGLRFDVAERFYDMGRALAELSRPERYKGELGFATFEALLEARGLPNRLWASKLIAVASTYPARYA